jgi:uncharacterized protein YlxP (DUF503 family)
MVIGLLTLDLHIPQARSLKDKRRAVRGLEARIKARYNVAVAEVGHHDLRQRARLAVVSVNTDEGHLVSTLEAVSGEAERSREIEVLSGETEIL